MPRKDFGLARARFPMSPLEDALATSKDFAPTTRLDDVAASQASRPHRCASKMKLKCSIDMKQPLGTGAGSCVEQRTHEQFVSADDEFSHVHLDSGKSRFGDRTA